uniref:Uncharacterized protein n=1 Tax=Chromera velia CCMP2878 TaxID=1169474 RepID=A0A0G4H4Y3_9ALVE|eukprot:Cvel_24696.t1-p1 / transcript=Cvel_24696.t1 / gene=Cvel_24696 / organism=Chromera_velia_CCMP2878 / gene_product=hypothetical protein / transcript_product=hypothetical protein / location=Cvel_scaffold2707:14632-17105(+) / protein_length=180 / sequence_SO=supercontig / SO=protein_coding / is_pseudo=false
MQWRLGAWAWSCELIRSGDHGWGAAVGAMTKEEESNSLVIFKIGDNFNEQWTKSLRRGQRASSPCTRSGIVVGERVLFIDCLKRIVTPAASPGTPVEPVSSVALFPRYLLAPGDESQTLLLCRVRDSRAILYDVQLRTEPSVGERTMEVDACTRAPQNGIVLGKLLKGTHAVPGSAAAVR